MKIIANVIWILSIIYTLGWCINVREKAKNEQAKEGTMEVHAFLLTVSVLLVPIFSISPFHLLWMIPASFIVGLLSLYFPFSILHIPASIYILFWYIGIRNKGREYYVSGNYEKAIDAFKESIRKTPNSAEAHFNLGLAYGKIGDSEKEIESYLEAIRLKPKVPNVHFNLGSAYKEKGNIQNAIESFKKALQIDNEYTNARYHLCRTYIEIGDRENAMKEYGFIQNADKNMEDELANAIKQL
jgi:tetratricopeptide (TPR) repeat protein